MRLAPAVEIRGRARPRARIADALFDFDGTLSLIRAGWVEVMLAMMLDGCPRLPDEDPDALAAELRRDIIALAGRPTMDQMTTYAARVRSRGGEAPAPAALKAEFLRRLRGVIDRRCAALARGDRASCLVAGADAALALLAARGVRLWLASGTDHDDVVREARLLGVAAPFADRVFGAAQPPAEMTKAIALERMRAAGVDGATLISFGDGPVEIALTKACGGLAIGVASDEDEPGSGRVDERKRALLIDAGADAIVADLADLPTVLAALVGTPT